jgi:hypothetical protein
MGLSGILRIFRCLRVLTKFLDFWGARCFWVFDNFFLTVLRAVRSMRSFWCWAYASRWSVLRPPCAVRSALRSLVSVPQVLGYGRAHGLVFVLALVGLGSQSIWVYWVFDSSGGCSTSPRLRVCLGCSRSFGWLCRAPGLRVCLVLDLSTPAVAWACSTTHRHWLTGGPPRTRITWRHWTFRHWRLKKRTIIVFSSSWLL